MRTLVTYFSILMVATCARASERAPEDTVYAFYAWVLAHPANALPSPEQRSELAKLLTPSTLRLVDAALRTEAECIAAAPPGDKPDVLEGDLFVGNYEGATEVAYGESVRRGDTVRVDATLLYLDPRFPKADKHRAWVWKDQLELHLVGEHWYVHDVHFAEKQSLIGRLKSYVEEGALSCTGP